MVRVAAYVDGFNLYYGLKEKFHRKYLWLDLHALISSMLLPNQTLEYVEYFTARVRDDPDAEQRQSDYVEALTATSVTVIDGRFQESPGAAASAGPPGWSTRRKRPTSTSRLRSSLMPPAIGTTPHC